jgi:hypothetical protein
MLPTVWVLHIGQSFNDAEDARLLSILERPLHGGVTTGCPDHYCPEDFVFRLQMAVFLARNQAAATTRSLQPEPRRQPAIVRRGRRCSPTSSPTTVRRHVHYTTAPPRRREAGSSARPGRTRRRWRLRVGAAASGVQVSHGPTRDREDLQLRSREPEPTTDVTASDIFAGTSTTGKNVIRLDGSAVRAERVRGAMAVRQRVQAPALRAVERSRLFLSGRPPVAVPGKTDKRRAEAGLGFLGVAIGVWGSPFARRESVFGSGGRSSEERRLPARRGEIRHPGSRGVAGDGVRDAILHRRSLHRPGVGMDREDEGRRADARVRSAQAPLLPGHPDYASPGGDVCLALCQRRRGRGARDLRAGPGHAAQLLL